VRTTPLIHYRRALPSRPSSSTPSNCLLSNPHSLCASFCYCPRPSPKTLRRNTQHWTHITQLPVVQPPQFVCALTTEHTTLDAHHTTACCRTPTVCVRPSVTVLDPAPSPYDGTHNTGRSSHNCLLSNPHSLCASFCYCPRPSPKPLRRNTQHWTHITVVTTVALEYN
jgi:hypothetical protein